MSQLGDATELPDPTWGAEELIDHAEGCTALSAAWLPALAALDPAALSNNERASLAMVMQRMTAVTEALALRALAAFPTQACLSDPALKASHPEAAGRMCPGGFACTHHWHLDAFSATTGLPKWNTDRRYNLAWWLDRDWQPLRDLLAGGRITMAHLDRFDRATSDANPEALAAAVTAVVDLVEQHPGVSADGLARSARRVVARHTDPAEAKVKQRDRVRERTGVSYDVLADGLAALTLTGEVHKLEAIRTLLRDHPAITAPSDDDDRTRGQREVDLLVSLCLLGSETGAYSGVAAPSGTDAHSRQGSATPARPAGPAGPGWPWPTGDAGIPGWAGTEAAAEPGVAVTITASLETLIGLSNEPGTVGDTTVSAALIRQWAADPAWVRQAVINHRGQVTSVGRRQRFPAGLLAAAVRLRWPRCTFPGCHRAATTAQLDHCDPYARGGDTSLDNLHPLCPKHHLLKDQPGYGVRLRDDGAAVWTLPGRRVVTVPAPDLRSVPGPHDGKPDDDWHADPPPPTALDDMPARYYETWMEELIARDPEHQAA